jgi:hypothetical protein
MGVARGASTAAHLRTMFADFLTESGGARCPGVGFMGGDWAFVPAEGELLGFAKLMLIKPRHRALYSHLFHRMHKALAPKGLSRPIGQSIPVVHPFAVRYPRLAAFTWLWSPAHDRLTTRHNPGPNRLRHRPCFGCHR